MIDKYCLRYKTKTSTMCCYMTSRSFIRILIRICLLWLLCLICLALLARLMRFLLQQPQWQPNMLTRVCMRHAQSMYAQCANSHAMNGTHMFKELFNDIRASGFGLRLQVSWLRRLRRRRARRRGEGGAAQRKHKSRAAPQAGPSKTAQHPGPTPTLPASQAISLLGLRAWRN